tara:strand:- start:51 stop:767 length:717 start_codon:yes stop_codon:yes gene_type:complete
MTQPVIYLTLAVLTLSSLYLIFLYKKTRKETEEKLQILDAKCNRLNTMLQTTTQDFEHTQHENLVEPYDVTQHSIPDTESLREESINTIQALKEEYENFESSNQFEFNNTLNEEKLGEEKDEEHGEEKDEELLNNSQDNQLSKELMEEIEALDTENMNQEEELEELENLLNETEELNDVEINTLKDETKSLHTTEYHDLTVKELKELARKKGLTLGGKKEELIDRLLTSSKQRTLSFN